MPPSARRPDRERNPSDSPSHRRSSPRPSGLSLALGTGLRLAEIDGLNVGDVFAPDGAPRSRVRIRPEIAKGGRAGDVFLPDALVPKLRRFWTYKRARGEGLDSGGPLLCSQACVRICERHPQDSASIAYAPRRFPNQVEGCM